MALDMDPELRRQLMELAEVHDRWQAEHGVDDAEWVPDGADSDRARPPSAQAVDDFMTRSRRVMGLDPETGLYPDARPPVLPAARSRDEALVYLDLHPCDRCGSADADWQSALVDVGDDMARRYQAGCGGCGTPRAYLFALPDRPIVPGPDDVVIFGGPEPSALLDPGEWLIVAERSARAVVPPEGGVPTEEERYALAVAVAAIEEVIKFIPSGAEGVPAAAFASVRGRAAYEKEPGRFQRRRLLIVRDSYRDALDGGATA
jgi:hypothetical protein